MFDAEHELAVDLRDAEAPIGSSCADRRPRPSARSSATASRPAPGSASSSIGSINAVVVEVVPLEARLGGVGARRGSPCPGAPRRRRRAAGRRAACVSKPKRKTTSLAELGSCSAYGDALAEGLAVDGRDRPAEEAERPGEAQAEVGLARPEGPRRLRSLHEPARARRLDELVAEGRVELARASP